MIPEEASPAQNAERCRAAERGAARWACGVVPLLALAALPALPSAAQFLVSLKVPNPLWDARRFTEGRTLAVFVSLAALPWFWRGWLWAEAQFARRVRAYFPVAPLLGLALLVAANGLYDHPRAQWFFLEAAKVRIERDRYERNVINWKFDNLVFDPARHPRSVKVIGSSQVLAAVDETMIRGLLPDVHVEVKWLSGFAIMEYQVAASEILAQRPTVLVCWISEFDVFREDRVPANRLRHHGSLAGALGLCRAPGAKEAWRNRAEIADIVAGALMPLWRDRDLVRAVAAHFWWPRQENRAAEEPAAAMARERENVRRAVRRTRLIEANLRSFRSFAERVVSEGVRLCVFEGVTHPDGMATYDPSFRRETRAALAAMAREVGFEFVPEEAMPRFTRDDFESIYHLNEAARERFTLFLAGRLTRHLGTLLRIESPRDSPLSVSHPAMIGTRG